LLIGGGLFEAGSAFSIVGIMNYSCIVLLKKNERVYICCLLFIMYSKERHIPRHSLITIQPLQCGEVRIESGVIVNGISLSRLGVRLECGRTWARRLCFNQHMTD
jgi:hypothetical protein